MVYLDYAANTPTNAHVLDKFYNDTLLYVGNANSSHALGSMSKKIIEETTDKFLNKLQIKESEIIYTSGSTESNNLIIKGVCYSYNNLGKHIIATELDHTSVLAPIQYLKDNGFEVDTVKLLSSGAIDVDHLKSLLRKDTILVSVPYVDGELGVLQPMKDIYNLIRENSKAVVFSDATQAVGKINVNFNYADLISFAPHKFYGLNGFGAVVKKENVRIEPMVHGGNSTTMYRAGTPIPAFITSSYAALEIALDNLDKNYNHVCAINNIILKKLSQLDNIIINSTIFSIPHIINFSIPTLKSAVSSKKFEDYNIFLSTKSSCCNVNTISRPVYALKKDKKIASSTLRISLSYLTTMDEINLFFEALEKILKSDGGNGSL